MQFADITPRKYGGHRFFLVALLSEAEGERIRKLAEELDAHRKRVQDQHPDLTLTRHSNVVEKLSSTALPSGDPRSLLPPSEGFGGTDEPPEARTTKRAPATLTAKESDSHDRSLVSILNQLHDDLRVCCRHSCLHNAPDGNETPKGRQECLPHTFCGCV